MAQHFLLSSAARSISLRVVLRLEEADAWMMFRRLRWPDTDGQPVCPHCNCTTCYDCPRGKSPRFRCKACRKDFSPTSGTLFAYHKLSIREYLAAVVIFVNAVKGISAPQLGRDLDVSYKTAFVLAHKLREAMEADSRGETVGGEGKAAEVDGLYTGGYIKPANHKENRRDRRLAANQNGKRRVVVAIRERDGRTLTAVFKSEDESLDFIRRRVAKGTTIHADEAAAWDDLRARFPMKRINHKQAYSANGACTNLAESFFSRLRRAEIGQHHHISGQYLRRYAAEMAWREDRRAESNGDQFAAIVTLAGALPPSVDFCGYWQRHKAVA